MTFKEWFIGFSPRLSKGEYLYGTAHLINFGVVAVLTILAIVIFKLCNKKTKDIILYCTASIYLLSWILIIIARCLRGNPEIKTFLPLDFCGIIVWVTIISILFKVRWLNEFLAVGGLLGSLLFLFLPEVGFNSAQIRFDDLNSIVIHDIMFIMSIIYFVFGYASIKWDTIYKQAICFGACAICALLLDYVIFKDANYMYIKYSPVPLNLGNFPYQIIFGLLLIGFVAGIYGFASLVRFIKNKKSPPQTISVISEDNSKFDTQINKLDKK